MDKKDGTDSARMSHHPVPREVLEEIGDVVVSFSMLERAIAMLAGSLIAEHQRVGQIITAELPFKNVRALTKSLYLERHDQDEDFGKLSSMLHRANKLEEDRNRLMHSDWGAGTLANSVTQIKTTAKEKKGYRLQVKAVSARDLATISTAIKRLACEVLDFHIYLMERGKAINSPLKKFW